tara:strand:+ start:33950 stop:34831 length:882 start_codon:yes stop_codon:yes gene_type:complete
MERPSTLPGRDGSAKRLFESIESKITNKSFKNLDPLRKYNLILFVLHLGMALFLLAYFNRQRKKGSDVQGINLELFEHAFRQNPDTNFAEVFSEQIAKIQEGGVTSLIVTFFMITAAFHLIYFLNPNNIYLDSIKNGNNFLRWIEYTGSATIIIIVLALLSGVKDINNYILITVASIGVMSTGQLFEDQRDPKKKWLPIVVGFVLLMGIFTVIFRAFRKRLKEAETAGFEVPSFLYAIVYVMFAFYASFGFVPVAQMVFKKDYRKSEYAYLTLSAVSKVSLGVLVAVGFSQRS